MRTAWRRPALLGALAAAWWRAAEWVIEAYVSYGGLAHRLSDASRIQGGLGWNIAVGDQLRALGGRCCAARAAVRRHPSWRPCGGTPCHCWLPQRCVAVRARRPVATLVPLACAASAAFPYLFMIGYAAPRFLLPAYALLAVPVADRLVRMVRAPGRTAGRSPWSWCPSLWPGIWPCSSWCWRTPCAVPPRPTASGPPSPQGCTGWALARPVWSRG